MLTGVALAWSLFQLWQASPLPFVFKSGVFNDTQARAIHLAFALFLAFTAFPARRASPRHRIPLQDWLLALAGAFSAAYLVLFHEELAGRAGAPTPLDLAVALVGMALLLEATRRALGPPLLVVAAGFLVYTFAGPLMPDVIAHKGASLAKTLSHQWLSTEGVFGVALGVSTSFVFLFVLFGALLERAGAGNYFIQVAFALLGHLRGGPAKAAVVSSAMTGVISGSSIANVVTTGTFTIPLMKRVGFPAHKAGAVEVAASTNGQLTPPIMGAAAFLMVEYVGISYLEVIRHALLPALLSYIALIYIVHLEALKAGMEGLPRRQPRSLAQVLLTWLTLLLGLGALTVAVYFGIGWLKTVFGDASLWVIGALVLAAYLGLLAYATRFPELVPDDARPRELPDPGPTVKSGLYFLLPVVILLWCLTVERFSPGLSAFYATLFLIFIVITQWPLRALFQGHGWLDAALRRGLDDLGQGLVKGARNMIGIGVATAAAGIVVGTVTLTGIGLVMTDFVEFVSGGNLLLMLLLTAVISLVLGMGLPTTANYIVVATLMAPVIVALGAQQGLVVPLIAVHLFVFYFGILADDTPPVGLAAFAAAAIARSDPIRTGLQGFAYDIRTAILPFMFIFNPELLLIGVEDWVQLLLILTSAVVAMLAFAAATQHFLLVRNRLWEGAVLLLVALTLFHPGFWWDRLFPPLEAVAPARLHALAAALPDGASLELNLAGETLDGDWVHRQVRLPLGPAAATPEQRLGHAGIVVRHQGEWVFLEQVVFGSPAAAAGVDIEWEIRQLWQPAAVPPKRLMILPALFLLAMVIHSQRRRAPAPRITPSPDP